METQRNEARDAAMIGAFFLGYAALVWYAAVRSARPVASSLSDRVIGALARAFHGHEHAAPSPAMEFARSIRDELIREENG